MDPGGDTVPITSTLGYGGGLLLETWSGEISAQDVREYWRGHFSGPNAAVGRSLADVRNARLLFSGVQQAEIMKAFAEPALRGRRWRTALLVRDPHQYGVARQHQAYASDYSSTRIFESWDEALAWVLATGVDDEPPPPHAA